MRKTLFVALCAMVAILFAVSVHAAVNGSDSIGAAGANGSANRSTATTTAANNVAQGGNTTQLNLTVTDLTDKWQGYFGETNGSLILGAGNSVFYNFGLLRANFVLATLDINFNFVQLRNGTSVTGFDVGTNLTAVMDLIFFNTTGDDPRAHVDSANRTFSQKNKIGGILGVDSTPLNPAASGFYSGIFQNGTVNVTSPAGTLADERKKFAFGVNVTADQTDFLGAGHTSDYELMVPVPTSGSTFGSATYFFFMDVE